MHLPVHCCVPRSAEEDLAASRRQDDAVRAAGRVLKGRSGQFGDIAYLEDDGTLLTGEGEWLLAAATRRFFTEVAASDVDFVSFFFFPQTGPNAGAFHLLIHNADRGIGKPVLTARLLRGARDPEGRSWSPSSRPTTGVRLEAAIDEIPLRAIVEAEESRDPPPRPGKQFRHAFVLLLQRHEGLLGARVRQLDRIRGCWEVYFFRATEGRATLSTAR